MITPTGVTSAQYWDAIKNGNPTHVRIVFANQNITLDDSDIYLSTGVTVTDILNGDTDLVFGKAVSKQMTTAILNSSKLDPLIWTGEFRLDFGVEIGSPAVTNWVTLGYFSGEKPNNVTSDEVIDFTAYDRMKAFDILADDYVNAIEYPATVQDIYDGLCAYVGITNVAGDELPNIMAREYASAPMDMEGYTCRDVLAWIAEASGTYAKINADGNVQLIWFNETTHVITGDEEYSVESADANDAITWDVADTYTWDRFDTLTWNDVCGYMETYSIDQYCIKLLSTDLTINYPMALGGNVYLIVDNPFLNAGSATEINNYIKPLYDRTKAFGGYLPVQIDAIGNWCIEAGDIITADVGIHTIAVPLFMKTMRWTGAVNDSYEATGNKTRATYQNEAVKEKVVNTKEIRLIVEGEGENYYQRQTGIIIDEYGVSITGNKYIKMEAGSNIQIKSGGELEVASGGAINVKGNNGVNIKSGGGVNIESGGNLGNSGKISVKSGGELEVESGGDLSIKSGGNLSVNSGGQIDINANGNLKLSNGGHMSIQTGHPYDKWQFDAEGLTFEGHAIVSDQYVLGSYITFGLSPWTGETIPNVQCGLFPEYNANADYANIIIQTWSSVQSGYQDTARVHFDTMVTADADYDYEGNMAYVYTENTTGGNCAGWLGSRDNIWRRIYGETIYYAFLESMSSREYKQEIEPLKDYGEAIDNLEPVSFVYKSEAKRTKKKGKTNRKSYGLIYEDTVKYLPEVCNDHGDEKTINYIELIPILLGEVKHLRQRVAELEGKGKSKKDEK